MFGLVHASELPGRNTCQIDRKSSAGWRRRRTPLSASVAEVLSFAGRCSDHNKGISPFPRRIAPVLALPNWPLFRAEKKGDSVLKTGGVTRKNFRATPSTMPPRQTRFLKTSVVDRGLNLHRSKPVLRTDSAWCPLPWQIVVSVRTATTLSGFSLRNKSIEFCAKR